MVLTLVVALRLVLLFAWNLRQTAAIYQPKKLVLNVDLLSDITRT